MDFAKWVFILTYRLNDVQWRMKNPIPLLKEWDYTGQLLIFFVNQIEHLIALGSSACESVLRCVSFVHAAFPS